MFENLVPISADRHKNKKIRKLTSHAYAKSFHVASAMVHEFSRCASTYPIVFLEDPKIAGFRPVALLGLEQGENLFVKDDKWDASYIPAILRRYPFALVKTKDEDRYAICVDEDSGAINDSEGEDLYDAKGQPTVVLENVKRYLGELQQMEGFTTEFCKYLTERNMFTPLNMKVRVESKVQNINGCYVINEERFNNLSDEAFLELRNKKYMAPIYAHLTSLAQIERLLKLKGATQEDNKV